MYAKVESAWAMVGAQKFLIRSISSGRTGDSAPFSTRKKAASPPAQTTAESIAQGSAPRCGSSSRRSCRGEGHRQGHEAPDVDPGPVAGGALRQHQPGVADRGERNRKPWMRKIDRQPNAWIRGPPATMPTTGDPAAARLHSPMIRSGGQAGRPRRSWPARPESPPRRRPVPASGRRSARKAWGPAR